MKSPNPWNGSMEQLESRTLLSAAYPTAGAQHAVDLDNVKYGLTPSVIVPGARLSVISRKTGGVATHDFNVVYSDAQKVDVSDLDNRDVLVRGPHSFSQVARFVRVNKATDGPVRTATYRITAPGGWWDARDNGIYSFTLARRQVRNTMGASFRSSSLGTFTVAIPVTALPITRVSSPVVSSAGGSTYRFTVTYGGSSEVNPSTLDSRDLLITCPGKPSTTATFIGIIPYARGTGCTAVYEFTAPGGSWDAADNGVYSIIMGDRQVRTNAGHFAAPRRLGKLTVSIYSI